MFRIIHRGTMELFRDRGALFFTVIFPSLLVFILGSLLSSMDEPDSNIGKITVLYVMESAEAAPDTAPVDAFLSSISENDHLTFTQSRDFSTAQQRVRDGEANAAVLFKQPLAVEIFEGGDLIKNRAVHLIMQSFSRHYAVISATATTAPQHLPEVLSALSAETDDLLRDYDLGHTRSMMDFYAVAMIVMIIFMGSSTGAAEDIYEGRRDFTLARSLASPKNKVNFYVQTQLSHIPQNVVQVLVVMLISTLFFGAHYAATAFDNIILFVMLFLCGMAMSAVFSLLGAVIRISPTAIILPTTWFLLFFSGTFSKMIFIEGFSNLMPPFLIQQAAFELTVFGRYGQCFTAIGIAIVIFSAATALGALLFRRKGFSV